MANHFANHLGNEHANSHALTWLKRYALTGKDEHGLDCKPVAAIMRALDAPSAWVPGWAPSVESPHESVIELDIRDGRNRIVCAAFARAYIASGIPVERRILSALAGISMRTMESTIYRGKLKCRGPMRTSKTVPSPSVTAEDASAWLAERGMVIAPA